MAFVKECSAFTKKPCSKLQGNRLILIQACLISRFFVFGYSYASSRGASFPVLYGAFQFHYKLCRNGDFLRQYKLRRRNSDLYNTY